MESTRESQGPTTLSTSNNSHNNNNQHLNSGSNQQKDPLNFNSSASVSPGSYPSRRVTLGLGGGGGSGGSHLQQHQQQQQQPGGTMSDRRGSLGSTGFQMDDIFGRRPSIGFDSDTLFGRRGSMTDSSTAALDQAILDLTQRRYSIAAASVPGSNGPASMPYNPPNMPNMPPGRYSPPPTDMNSSQGSSGHGMSIAVRQQQLQQQQRELEQRQKELEMQRQQLITSMQERSMMMHRNQQDMVHSSRGVGRGGEQMGPGSTHSRHSQGSQGGASVHSNATSGSGNQQWWICQVCNSKAFASHEEAMQHEAVCQPIPQHSSRGEGYNNTMSSMPSQPPHHSFVGPGDYNGNNNMVASMNRSSGSRRGGMDNSTASYNNPALSTGPFAPMERPMPLAMEFDKDWLTPLHCFVRRHCVEVFTATSQDVATPSKGKRKPIQVGQVGIRCPHCCRTVGSDSSSNKARERGSVYYPTAISSIYNATMNLLQRHLHSCTAVPEDVMRRYETLKADDARSGTSKRYWVESALSLGLVDTATGIRFSALRPPPLPSLTYQQESTRRRNSNELFSTSSNAVSDAKGSIGDGSGPPSTEGGRDTVGAPGHDKGGPLVEVEDKPYSTAFSFYLMSQMQPCVFTEADRLGKRKGLPPGFPGLACRHCFGGYGSGRFFPSSIKTLSDTSKTLNVLHNHMMRCRKCPPEIRDQLDTLRSTHDSERAKMKFGSQKAYFARIWDRLHGKNAPPVARTLTHLKRKVAPPPAHVHPSSMPYSGGMSGGPGLHMQHQLGKSSNNNNLSNSSHGSAPSSMADRRSFAPPPSSMPMSLLSKQQQEQREEIERDRPPQTGDMGGLDSLARAAVPSPPKRQKTQ